MDYIGALRTRSRRWRLEERCRISVDNFRELLDAKQEYEQDVQRAQREPCVMNLRHPRGEEMKSKLGDSPVDKLGNQIYIIRVDKERKLPTTGRISLL